MKLRLASVCVCLVGSAAWCGGQSAVLSPQQSADETNTILKDLIRFDTQNPPGNETQVAQYIAGIFKREGIAYEVLEPVPGRASIVAR